MSKSECGVFVWVRTNGGGAAPQRWSADYIETGRKYHSVIKAFDLTEAQMDVDMQSLTALFPLPEANALHET